MSEIRETGFLGHPPGLFICFATELWERFSFYGMKYLLLLYLTKYHLFSDAMGLGVLGSYAALVYAMPVLGGMLADRYLGMRKSVTFGAILLCLGHLGMAFEGQQAHMLDGAVVQDTFALQVFYFSLALIVVGVGFLKPNISTIVGRLYAEGDPRRDAGFTIFYMGINIGAFTATLLCGYLGETLGWSYGFGAAGIGMLLGLATFLLGQKHLHGHAEPHDPQMLREKVFGPLSREWVIYLVSVASLFLVWQMVQFEAVVHQTLNVLSLGVLIWLVWFVTARCNAEERGRMIALATLTVFAVVFWALFEQSAASMTFFADRVLDRSAFGVTFTAAQLGALNSMFIFLLAPVFALIWQALGRRGKDPSPPMKFVLGIAQVGLGFGALVMGSTMPNEAGQVALIWFVLAYLLHTTGELCLSPVGLSAVTKLAVPSVVGVMMGAWFLATAYSEFIAVQLSKLAAVDTPADGVIDVNAARDTYSELFTQLLWLGLGVAFVLLILVPVLKRLMGHAADVEPDKDLATEGAER